MLNLINPEPQIIELPAFTLVGKRLSMSVANNRTAELWKSFMPQRKHILSTVDEVFYSLEVYDSLDFFTNFDPTRTYEKWAAMAVTQVDQLPEGMEPLTVPAGGYAVFAYKGRSSEGAATYRYIYSEWLPQSGYQLDNRPHFARMDERYRNNDPNSEEDIYIPIKL